MNIKNNNNNNININNNSSNGGNSNKIDMNDVDEKLNQFENDIN